MSVPKKDLLKQLNEISHLNELALKEVDQIKWPEGGWPIYPDSLNTFFRSISKSDWVHSLYNRFDRNTIFLNIANADFESVTAAFTYLCRSEKWLTGSWGKYLENDQASSVIKRAFEVLEDFDEDDSVEVFIKRIES